MKSTKRLSPDSRGPAPRPMETYAPPTPRVTKQKQGKTLTAEERAAFLAGRPDLPSKG
jgi:hypothetical protein